MCKLLWIVILFMARTIVDSKYIPCKGTKCRKSSMPLVDDVRAPLYVELDTNSLNKQLKNYIDTNVELKISEILANKTETFMDQKLKQLKIDMIADITGNLARNNSICYQCDRQVEFEKCHNITFCDIDEKCFISEEIWLGEKIFRSGCRDKNQCQTLRDGLARSIVSISCCNGDLCNFGSSTTRVPSVTPSAIGDRNKATVSNKITAVDYTSTAMTVATSSAMSTTLRDSKGHDFIMLFVGSTRKSKAKLLTLGGVGQISAQYFEQSRQQIITIGQNINEHSVDKSVFTTYMTYGGIRQTGVKLHGNIETSVFGFMITNVNYNKKYCEGYLGLPSQYLSNIYVIPSLKEESDDRSVSFIAITPRDGTTMVNLTFKMNGGEIFYNGTNYYADNTLTVVIKQYETFEISHSYDLTGTKISSSDPVAVISGKKCKRVYCHLLVEMVLPVEQLDITFIIPHMNTYKNSRVRIIGVVNTTVTIEFPFKTFTHDILANDYYDFHHDSTSYIHATNPVSVMLYPQSTLAYEFEFMMTIHGTNQYLSEYDFAVPTGYTSFISVAVASDNLTGFLLNGELLSIDSIYTNREKGGTYSSFSVSVRSGGHRMSHTRNIRFGLWVYGNKPIYSYNHHQTYGYPAGIALKAAP